ncbi:hypothetical protein PISL3812_09210 [Talaromyces islandicus]|uniref:Uncharacterized protein n=1 Tax=Talaromyces islandicus TaxID=28573 RepID=A0A0U1M928_TALIS|nr:hypothetical protein PISL3812_09210 [Talaromyces islandicus]
MKAYAASLQAEQPPKATIHRRDEDIDDTEMKSSQEDWNSYFSKFLHSNNALRKLIPDALAALKQCPETTDWKTPIDLPGPLLEWLTGQRGILFPKTLISSFDDVKKNSN